MRSLKVILIALFLIVAIAFSVLFCYDRMIIDHVAPQIFCDGEKLEVSVSASDAELCKGLSATDDVDGDITDRIIVRRISRLVGSNSAIVDYAVFDSASNYCTYRRSVYYTDYQQPRFSLTQPMIYNVNATVSLDDRLKAMDVLDGDISARIRVSSASVTSAVEGEYPLGVQVTNSTGDTAVLKLTVCVRNYTSRHPVIHLSEYLSYVERDSELTEQDLRALIVSARESETGASVDAKDITISGDVDTSRPGSYDVRYSYLNEQNLSYEVILTVVVQ